MSDASAGNPVVCAECGSSFVLPAVQHGWPQKFCSPRCRSRQNNRVSNKSPKRRAYLSAYRCRNKERIMARDADYYQRTKEYHAQWMRQWGTRNKEHIRLHNRDYYLEHRADYRRRERAWMTLERQRLKASRRRARQYGNGGRHTMQEWLEKCELFAWCCAYCGEARPLGRDHRIPIARGGSDDIANIVPACKPCNSRKGKMTDIEFIYRRRSAA